MGQQKSKLRCTTEEIPCHESLKPSIEDISKREYPFENLVFEGGGARGTAYCGVVQALEEVGLLRKMHRFAGASAGAIVAACLSVDMRAVEVMESVWELEADMLFDAPFGVLSALPRIWNNLGWLTADQIYQMFRRMLERKTGNPDITFKEVYDRYGNELCVIVTNITTKSVEYLHPKTSPHISLAMAIRTSMAIPLLMQPVELMLFGSKGLYVDGGVLCNYPINCFDGWFLSMKPEDSFFNKFGYTERFNERNPKTLGFLLYSSMDHEVLHFDFMHRLSSDHEKLLPPRPDTKFARKLGKQVDAYVLKKKEKHRRAESVVRFLTYIQEQKAGQNGFVDKDAFMAHFSKAGEIAKDFDVLFRDRTLDEAFDVLDDDKDGKFTIEEFLLYMNKRKVPLHQLTGSYKHKIRSLGDYVVALMDCLDITGKKLYVKSTDLERTVGIFTDYIGTTDFDMEDRDHVYLKRLGETLTLGFLEAYGKESTVVTSSAYR